MYSLINSHHKSGARYQEVSQNRVQRVKGCSTTLPTGTLTKGYFDFETTLLWGYITTNTETDKTELLQYIM